MKQLTTVEIHRDDLGFAAGHFTIFSETHRETMHGHNYTVYTAITTEINENGLTFDYRHYKQKIREICRHINCTFLLPLYSPYLRIEEQGDQVIAHFGSEKIPFLKKDIFLLPIRNTTVEELSQWFVNQLTEHPQELKAHAIHSILVKIYSSPGQSGSAIWERTL